MNDNEWPTDWLRGVLEVAVLRVLTGGPSYGYAITATLAEAGFGTIKGGTLYPLLGRLEAAGDVEIEWRAGEGGPGRKYFSLTDSGRRRAAALAQRWASFAALTTAFITSEENHV